MEIENVIIEESLDIIYFAGGCFWGVEEYMSRLDGVVDVISGYANGTTVSPTYEEVIHEDTGHVETVKVVYDSKVVSLNVLLSHYFRIVDPTILNRQGNDIGTQYRTGIYYTGKNDLLEINRKLDEIKETYDEKIVVEVEVLDNFYEAEEYHQDYLEKNPYGYCHISFESVEELVVDSSLYTKMSDEEIKKALSKEVYNITQNKGTEHAFSNKYFDHFEKGIYVDVVTREPLFSSLDKYESNCGWPSFTKAIAKEVVIEVNDTSFNMLRTEVISRVGKTHLGHVFTDGPKELTGLRYCINSASIDFVSFDYLKDNGYEFLVYIFN